MQKPNKPMKIMDVIRALGIREMQAFELGVDKKVLAVFHAYHMEKEDYEGNN